MKQSEKGKENSIEYICRKSKTMKKTFNITGVCYPHIHYVADTSEKLRQIMEMVERGDYFVITRPRQYGKSTMLHFIGESVQQLEDYLQISMNFQGIDSKWHESDAAFSQMFVDQIARFFEFQKSDLQEFIEAKKKQVEDMDSLSQFITRLAYQSKKKLVLLIDEVDACSNFEPFMRFLGMLRTKHSARFSPQHATFHSVIIASIHDVRTLDYLSPWNIAADFEVDMNFSPKEIASILKAYSEAENVKMDIAAISERLYYYTTGYAFLVSKLCKTIAESFVPTKDKKTWLVKDVEDSVKLLLKETNTNFENLIKNLESDSGLCDLVHEIVVNNREVYYSISNPVIQKGVLYGIFKRNHYTDRNVISIHNRIYEQFIYNYLTSQKEAKT